MTFYANGKALSGTPSYSPSNGGYSYAQVIASLMTADAALSKPGTYAITAAYSGDANYTSSSSPATSMTLLYPTPIITMTPQAQTVNFGGTATVTAVVSGGNKSTYPSGTITFADAGTFTTVAGPTGCTNATDSNGNYACKVSATFTVTDGNGVWAYYSGDANYPASNAFAYITMPDFSIGPSTYQVNVTAGQSQNITFSIGSIAGFTGPVTNFSCSELPAEAACTFNPTQVTANPGGQSVSTTMTITTAAVGQSRNRLRAGRMGNGWLSAAGLLLLGTCFIGLANPRRRALPVVLVLLGVGLMLPSCGGGGSSGGGGGGNSNPVPQITSLSPAQVAAGSQLANGLTINGTNFMSGTTVTVGGVQVSGTIPSATQIVVGVSPSQVATVGQVPVVVTNPAPGGGPSNAVNLGVTTGTPTGSFNITVSAASGGLTHSVQLNLIVQ